jgi:hypothetical protein
MVLARKLLIADSDQLYPFSVKKKLGHPAEFFSMGPAGFEPATKRI